MNRAVGLKNIKFQKYVILHYIIMLIFQSSDLRQAGFTLNTNQTLRSGELIVDCERRKNTQNN